MFEGEFRRPQCAEKFSVIGDEALALSKDRSYIYELVEKAKQSFGDAEDKGKTFTKFLKYYNMNTMETKSFKTIGTYYDDEQPTIQDEQMEFDFGKQPIGPLSMIRALFMLWALKDHEVSYVRILVPSMKNHPGLIKRTRGLAGHIEFDFCGIYIAYNNFSVVLTEDYVCIDDEFNVTQYMSQCSSVEIYSWNVENFNRILDIIVEAIYRCQ